jgi:hypothetical protein
MKIKSVCCERGVAWSKGQASIVVVVVVKVEVKKRETQALQRNLNIPWIGKKKEHRYSARLAIVRLVRNEPLYRSRPWHEELKG